MQPEADKLLDFAARYTEAWCSQDPARVAALYSANGSLTVNRGAAAVGRTAIAEVARSFMATFPDMRVIMDTLLVQPDYAEYHWTLTGTNTAAGGKGYKIRISGFEKWHMDANGLIASSEGQFDASEYRRQLEQGA